MEVLHDEAAARRNNEIERQAIGAAAFAAKDEALAGAGVFDDVFGGVRAISHAGLPLGFQ